MHDDTILTEEQRRQIIDDLCRQRDEAEAAFIDRCRAIDDEYRKVTELELETAKREYDKKRKAVSND